VHSARTNCYGYIRAFCSLVAEAFSSIVQSVLSRAPASLWPPEVAAMVGTAVFGGWMANIDVSQASQGLAGGRSFSEAKGSWGQTRGGNKLERMRRLLLRVGVGPSCARRRS